MNKRGRKLGHSVSVETRKKMSDSKLGTTQPQETKDKISESMKKMWKNLKDRAGELEEK